MFKIYGWNEIAITSCPQHDSLMYPTQCLHRDVPHTDAHICARTLAHTRAKFTVPGPVTVRRLWYFNGTECFKKNGQIHTRTPNPPKGRF